MSKVVYLSYQPSEGVMTSLGMDVRMISKEQDMLVYLRQLKRQKVSLVYVSEAIYQDHTAIIKQYDKEFDLTVSILANQLHHKDLGEKRMNKIIEEAIGIKVG